MLKLKFGIFTQTKCCDYVPSVKYFGGHKTRHNQYHAESEIKSELKLRCDWENIYIK